MNVEGRTVTRRRGDAEKERDISSLCASAPLRGAICIVICLMNLHCSTSLPVSAVNVGDVTASESSPPVQQNEKMWQLARGNALADGVAKTKLPEKLEVVWKVTIDKGAFD